jgi:hypothetical protein
MKQAASFAAAKLHGAPSQPEIFCFLLLLCYRQTVIVSFISPSAFYSTGSDTYWYFLCGAK